MICKSDNNAALYSVEETWQIPPPISSTTLPPLYIGAALYPASIVLFPTTLLYENSSQWS